MAGAMETVLGCLSGVTYHTFDTVYDLVFTSERVIAFIIQHPSDALEYPSMWETVATGRLMARRREQHQRAASAEARRLTLQEKTPAELLAAHPVNFEVRYSAVTSVEITRHLLQLQLVFDVSPSSATRRPVRFNLSKKHLADAQDLVDRALAPKVKRK